MSFILHLQYLMLLERNVFLLCFPRLYVLFFSILFYHPLLGFHAAKENRLILDPRRKWFQLSSSFWELRTLEKQVDSALKCTGGHESGENSA